MMKKLFIILMFASLSANGQDSIPQMELRHNGFTAIGIDSLKKYVVADFPEIKKNKLFNGALVYLNSFYRNPEEVLSTVENESIVINAFTESVRGEVDGIMYPMHYNINLRFKDGRMRIEPMITELNEVMDDIINRKIYIASTDSSNDAETNCIWMIDKNGDYFAFRSDIKNGIDEWLNLFIKNLISGIEDNDW